ncbi:MAG: serine/threonine-protein kinase [Isosphaeraceae bacterium]|nr:serine/threonine-protein kinase [Isosphaeraceae bacterium]
MTDFDDDHRLIIALLETGLLQPTELAAAIRQWREREASSLAEFLVASGRLSADALPRLIGSDSSETTVLSREPAIVDPEATVGANFSPRGPGGDESTIDVDANPGRFDPTYRYQARTSDAERFEKREFVGKGGHAEVWRAYDRQLRREVAWKQVREDLGERLDLNARLMREAGRMAALDHPGITPVHGLGSLPSGVPYYIMRFVEGRNLGEAIRDFHSSTGTRSDAERSLALRELLGRFIAVCNTIEYAHVRATLHRDLKPANIRIGPWGETLVMDWGLTKLLSDGPKPGGAGDDDPVDTAATAEPPSSEHDLDVDLTLTPPHVLLGTYQYIAPEASRAERGTIGRAVDIWGLGAVLFEILTGDSPYSGKPLPALIVAARRGEIRSDLLEKPAIPRALAAVARRALAANPEDRYPSAEAIADDVARWLADEPVSVHTDSFATRIARFARRRRTAVITAAAVAVTAIPILLGFTIVLADANQELERSYRAFYNTHQPTSRALINVFFEYARRLRLEFPGGEALAIRMYDSGLEIARALAANAPPSLRRESAVELAKSLSNVATFQALIRTDDGRATGLLREATRILDREREDSPPGDSIHRLGAETWYRSAELRRARGETARALDDSLAASAILRDYLDSRSDDRAARSLAARVLYGRASSLSAIERHEPALELAARARGELEELARKARPEENIDRWLSQAEKVEARILLRIGDHRAARAAAERSLARLSSTPPNSPDRRFLIADHELLVARIALAQGRRDDAAAAFARCRKEVEADIADAGAMRLLRNDALFGELLCRAALARLAAGEALTQALRADLDRGLALFDSTRSRAATELEQDALELEAAEAILATANEPSARERAEAARRRIADRRAEFARIP